MLRKEENSSRREHTRLRLTYKMGRKTCPKCGGEDIMMVTGGLTGAWKCKDCSYENDIFPEKEEIAKAEKKRK